MLTETERRDLIKYRIEKAYRTFKEAEDNARLNHWSLAGNRLYYSAFHIVQALLLDNGLDAHTHSGLIHVFGQHFIANGKLDKSYGRLMTRLFELRQSGDYNDMYDATEEDVSIYFAPVKGLLSDIEDLIINK